MAYTTIDNPELYFQTKLYSGNNSTNAITLDGSENMQPDWLWIKCRSNADSSQIVDSVRGTNALRSDDTHAEADISGNGFTSYDSDGFTLNGSNGGGNVNNSGRTYVAWNWKAGTSFTNDASSTGIGSIDSSGSVNETAGFSICSYTGTGSVATIKHGLSTIPNVIITKSRANTENWGVLHSGINTDYQTDYLILNTNAGSGDSAEYYNDTAPTSSIFTVGTADATNDAANMIAYIFSERKGYSKFGSYTGNGNADGTFIYTGFKPAFIMYKNTARSISWLIHDNKRLGYNPDNDEQHPDTNAADGTDDRADILSNGFKIRESSNLMNVSGEVVIYMAFAESPFVNSKGVPTTAR
jgi:hypothetical protein